MELAKRWQSEYTNIFKMTIRDTQTRQAAGATSLPNLLTYGRILLVAVMVSAFFLEGDLARFLFAKAV